MRRFVCRQRPDASNDIDNLLVIQTVFESRHPTVPGADKVRQHWVRLFLYLLRLQVGRVHAFADHTARTIFAVTYQTIRLKQIFPERGWARRIGGCRQTWLCEK